MQQEPERHWFGGGVHPCKDVIESVDANGTEQAEGRTGNQEKGRDGGDHTSGRRGDRSRDNRFAQMWVRLQHRPRDVKAGRDQVDSEEHQVSRQRHRVDPQPERLAGCPDGDDKPRQ